MRCPLSPTQTHTQDTQTHLKDHAECIHAVALLRKREMRHSVCHTLGTRRGRCSWNCRVRPPVVMVMWCLCSCALAGQQKHMLTLQGVVCVL